MSCTEPVGHSHANDEYRHSPYVVYETNWKCVIGLNTTTKKLLGGNIGAKSWVLVVKFTTQKALFLKERVRNGKSVNLKIQNT